jgi:hypothetical protein
VLLLWLHPGLRLVVSRWLLSIRTLGSDGRLVLVLGKFFRLAWHHRRLCLHLVLIRGASAEQETSLPATAEEHDHCPHKGCDEQQPHEGTKASNSSEHGRASLEEDDTPLGEAGLAVEQAAVVDTSIRQDIDHVPSPLGGDGGKRCEPHDYHEAFQDQDGDDVVQLVQARELLGEDDIGNDDPGE